MSSETNGSPPSCKVMVTGAAGFMGKKLVAKIVSDGGKLKDGRTATELILMDVVKPSGPEGDSIPFTVKAVEGDLSVAEDMTSLMSVKPDVIFHLAAIVSGDAEKNFEKGYSINMDGTRNLLEAIRSIDGYTPRIVFASSAAVFGGSVPDPIPDTHHLTPRTSYGTQKAICELLVDDYSRKGYVDGISIRFPTISVRPGKPNKAASSFISGIIREPLAGVETICPVGRHIKHPVASPRRAVEYLLTAASIPTEELTKGSRSFTMPAIRVSVGEMLDAMEKVAGKEVLDLVKMETDEFVEGIIGNWQFNFESKRAKELGFQPDKCFEDIVQAHIDDELGGAVHKAKKTKEDA